jgi:hypothetical protein
MQCANSSCKTRLQNAENYTVLAEFSATASGPGDRFNFATRLSFGGLAQRLFPFTRFGDEFALRKLMVPPWHELASVPPFPEGDARGDVLLPLPDIKRVIGLQAERLSDFIWLRP